MRRIIITAMLCASVAVVSARQSKPADFKGLQMTATSIERSMTVSLTDCPPGANVVHGNAKDGETFIVVNVAFKVTPAFKETIVKKPVLLDSTGKTFNT